MEQLSPLDCTFLELEQSDDGATMHIGAALIFDPVPGSGGAPAPAQVHELMRQRMTLLPRFTKRLDAPRAHGLRRPRWVEDPHFDLDRHVRHATLPAPGGEDEVEEWLSDFWSHRLDRAHPLWETTLVDGLAGGRWMLATKTHHALVDGVGSLDIGYALLDTEPEGRRIEPPDAAGREPRPGLPGWLPPVAAYKAMRTGWSLARHPRAALEGAAAAAEVLWHDEVHPAPETSLNVPIGATRRFRSVTFDLEEVKAVKRALGGTVNDVVLAIATGGLRRFLSQRDDPLDRPLRAMVPVNVRPDTEQGNLGNHVTSLFVELPVGEPDPLDRYALARDSARELKSGTAARGGETLVLVTGLLPPALHEPVAASLFAKRLFNLTITNVPGPQFPLYMLGARLREIQPLVPLFTDHAVGLAITSYDGTLTFGINADSGAIPDADLLTEAIVESFEELQALAPASASSATSRSSSSRSTPPASVTSSM
jgi:diacylglycerol O-acyltransferase / wax synthase